MLLNEIVEDSLNMPDSVMYSKLVGDNNGVALLDKLPLNVYPFIDKESILEQGIREAVKDFAGFFLQYQPQIDILSGKVVGAEALIRWNFNGELIQPCDFISIAEKLDLIVQLSEWVLREACFEARRWDLLGLGGEEGIKVGVNISAKQLADNLPDLIKSVLTDSGLHHKLLGLEITESFLVDKNFLSSLHILKNRGIQLSIDDFGIGYSCLAQLKDLPIDTLKIDREFVKNIGESRNFSVLESIVNLAQKLGMKTLAEGVEIEAEAEVLRKLGCTTFQGFLYSKPLSGDDFIKYVMNSRELNSSYVK